MGIALRVLGVGGMARLLALILLTLGVFALPASAQTFPKFTGLVVDDAGVLPEQTKAELTTKLEALQRDTKRQLVVATISDLQGYPIEDYGYRLGRAWNVGLRDVTNGAILIIAPNDRKVRVEIARGLQPFLTDALSSVVINQDMLPRLRTGDYSGAAVAGTDALIRQLRASPEEAQARLDAAEKQFDAQHRRRNSNGGSGFPLGLVFWALVIGFVLLSIFRRGSSGMGGGGTTRRYRSRSGMADGLGQVVLWGIANEIASNAFRGGGGHSDDGVRGWGSGDGGWGGGGGGGSDGPWGGGGFTGGGGGGGGFDGGGASGSW